MPPSLTPINPSQHKTTQSNTTSNNTAMEINILFWHRTSYMHCTPEPRQHTPLPHNTRINMTNISNILTSTPSPHLAYPSRVSEHEPEAEDDQHSDAKMSLDTAQAGRLISRSGATWHDNNRSGKTTIYY